MTTAILITCLVLLLGNAVLEVIDLVRARRGEMEALLDKELEAQKEAEIALANQKYDDQMFQWFAALANNTAYIRQELNRIANLLEQEPATPKAPAPEPVSDPEAERMQMRIEQGIQNILNYGFAQAVKRGEGE